ncbi:putative biotin--protein ligase [Penaeus vannamei]|uniref:Putative biotin--protein ligase n=1 Tax=Penaeus vannamei TaxID=6689 RepID=A0A423SHR0_PENVA|nr:putative biotin--protein ligase [Penaeus vannamei]
MLSMCGLLCRMLRGWRHSEAVMLMAKALSQPHSSLLVQDILASDSGIIKVNEPSCTSIFCQNSNEGSIGQLLWRDNNKQAVVIAPKQRVDLKRWTLFMMAADHPSNSHPRESAQQASENGFPSAKSEVSTTITVLLEASYREQEDNELLDCYVMVEQLSQPYAWKARDVFGVIVTTTPPQLLAMIQAFFNNALIVDDDFLITKIITVDLVGQPSTFDDPLSIPESVTPGPWTTERATCTQMELARSVSPTNFNVGQLSVKEGDPMGACGISLHPPTLSAVLRQQSSAESATDTSTTLHPQSSSDSDKRASSLDPQSSYDSVSDYPTSDTDDLSCNVYNFYPRGWAVSGQQVVSGQPLSVRGVLNQLEGKQYRKPCSIVSNPMEDLWQESDEKTKVVDAGNVYQHGSLRCMNGPAGFSRRSETLLKVRRGSSECTYPYRCIPGKVICQNIQYSAPGKAEQEIVKEAAEYYQRAVSSAQERREWAKKSFSSTSEDDGPPLSGKSGSKSSGRSEKKLVKSEELLPPTMKRESCIDIPNNDDEFRSVTRFEDQSIQERAWLEKEELPGSLIPDSLNDDLGLVIELTSAPIDSEKALAAKRELIRQERMAAMSLMSGTLLESRDEIRSEAIFEKGSEFDTVDVEKCTNMDAVHGEENIEVNAMAAGASTQEDERESYPSSLFDSGVDIAMHEHVSSINSSLSKSLVSPVESAAESGFSSLKEPLVPEGAMVEDSGPGEHRGVCLSKSKDSLDLTDTDKFPGTDTLSDDMETLSSNAGDITLVESGPVSKEGSARGSVSDGIYQDNGYLRYGSESSHLDLDSVGIPNTYLKGTHYETAAAVDDMSGRDEFSPNAGGEKLTQQNLMRHAEKTSISTDIVDYCNRLQKLSMDYDKASTVEKFDQKSAKYLPDESEASKRKTSESISSEDTVISKVSAEEQNNKIQSQGSQEDQMELPESHQECSEYEDISKTGDPDKGKESGEPCKSPTSHIGMNSRISISSGEGVEHEDKRSAVTASVSSGADQTCDIVTEGILEEKEGLSDVMNSVDTTELKGDEEMNGSSPTGSVERKQSSVGYKSRGSTLTSSTSQSEEIPRDVSAAEKVPSQENDSPKDSTTKHVFHDAIKQSHQSEKTSISGAEEKESNSQPVPASEAEKSRKSNKSKSDVSDKSSPNARETCSNSDRPSRHSSRSGVSDLEDEVFLPPSENYIFDGRPVIYCPKIDMADQIGIEHPQVAMSVFAVIPSKEIKSGKDGRWEEHMGKGSVFKMADYYAAQDSKIQKEEKDKPLVVSEFRKISEGFTVAEDSVLIEEEQPKAPVDSDTSDENVEWKNKNAESKVPLRCTGGAPLTDDYTHIEEEEIHPITTDQELKDSKTDNEGWVPSKELTNVNKIDNGALGEAKAEKTNNLIEVAQKPSDYRVFDLSKPALDEAVDHSKPKLARMANLERSDTAIAIQRVSDTEVPRKLWLLKKRLHEEEQVQMQMITPLGTGSAVSVEPTHVEITDECGGQHRLNLSILATDDTWGAPSLLSARLHGGNGKAVFSQVHLERDPQECFGASNVPSKLSVSNEARLEILRDLLNSELSMDTTSSSSSCVYTAAYFLGRHELKQDLLNRLQPHLENQELKRPQLTLQFVNAREIAKQADEDLLPLLMNACPMTFSTVRYFETLKTTSIGRLVIYCDVMTTSMKVTAGHPPLIHGITVVPTQQTQGKGCAMFTTQLHIPLSSNLGQHLPFLQHLVAIAIVQAVREYPGYGDIPLNLKWPNDIYIAGDTKVGGVIVEATTIGKEVIANVGCGINLSNSNPTYCINDAVRQHNKEHKTSLPEIDRETFLARIFNHFEGLIDTFQKDGPEAVCPIYYKYWLHSNAVVTVQNENRSTENAVITGVDNYGFLIAHLVDGTMITLQPDGNSFDMMEGLIYSKLQ